MPLADETLCGMATSQLIDLSDLVFLRREAIAQGYTDSQICALVRSGTWHRIRRGAYVAAEVWRSLSDVDRYRLRARAVLRVAHGSAVLSHVTAAVEWGAPVWGLSLDDVHTTRTDGAGGRHEAGVVHHRGTLPASQVATVNGVPTTTPVRCALEVTTLGTVEQALVTVNGLLHSRLMEPADFAALCHEYRFWPSSLNANIVARLGDPRLESAGESRTAYWLWAERLPRAIPQFEIRDHAGRVVARVDFAWPEHGVFLEFDGLAKYRVHRRPGESLEEFLLREKRREELICQLTGWTCLRIRWADLDRPAELAARIRRVLASREPG